MPFPRSGSITLGALVITGIVALAAGVGLGEWHGQHRLDREQAESAAALATEQDARRVEVATLTGDLGECRARVTAESLTAAATGTTDALGAALAPELADVQARAGLVSAAGQMEAQRALLAVASPQMLAAEVALARCVQMTALKSTDQTGCGNSGPIVAAWSAAVARLAECPEPSEGQAPE